MNQVALKEANGRKYGLPRLVHKVNVLWLCVGVQDEKWCAYYQMTDTAIIFLARKLLNFTGTFVCGGVGKTQKKKKGKKRFIH